MAEGPTTRRLAIEALVRIERDDAFANLVLPAMLERPSLSRRDRAFVSELVYGTTRQRRALDWLIDGFLSDTDVDREARAALRVGTYQLRVLGIPPHAAVGETVAVVPRRLRGFVNAVLRRIAEAEPVWPDDAVRLSYPDWIVDLLIADLGRDDALGALAAMNEAPGVTRRDDGYVQDRASQWVAASVGVEPGELVVDLCAAPGGKATAMAAAGGRVLAVDRRERRARLVADNASRLGVADAVQVVVSDARRAAARPHAARRVLLDAPCSGLGVLGRRPDARWRAEPEAVDRLATLQRQLLDAAVSLPQPGGRLVYSVCTLTRLETLDVDAWLADAHPQLEALPPLPPPWRPLGRGSLLLPQDARTDGMYVLRLDT